MNQTSGQQLALGIALNDEARFDNFLVSSDNAQVKSLLSDGNDSLFIWGPVGSGRSHLLQACCHELDSAIYLPLADMATLSPEVLEGVESLALICIDDLQAVLGQLNWEHALFALFNAIREQGRRLLVMADAAPLQLDFALPDLRSRMQSLVVMQLQTLDDANKKRALQLRAQQRGLELEEAVAEYLLRRVGRDMHALIALLERLDAASLAHQRRLSVPFVKQELNL